MVKTNTLSLVAAIALLLLTANEAAADLRAYQIQPGGTYTYKPSPEGPGIPGGEPSDFELDFGVGGEFIVEYDDAADTARLLNVELSLTGNEAIQTNPPAFAPVTADRVETWLEERLFHDQFVLAPWTQYNDETFDDLRLYDLLQGSVRLEGGFDHTPVDGPAMLFNLSAVEILIPEPGALAIVAPAVAAALRARRR